MEKPLDYNLVALAIIAFCNMLPALIAAIFSWRAHTSAYAARVDIRKVELATNSMKDALVAATGRAAHAAGVEEGRKAK